MKSVKEMIYERKVRRIIKDNMPGDAKHIYKVYKGYRDTNIRYKSKYIYSELNHKDGVALIKLNKLIKQLL